MTTKLEKEMNEFPILKMELQSQKMTILNAFNSKLDEIKKIAEIQVDKAINEFDFFNEAKAIIEDCLKRSLKQDMERMISACLYDSGLYETVRNELSKRIGELITSKDADNDN